MLHPRKVLSGEFDGTVGQIEVSQHIVGFAKNTNHTLFYLYHHRTNKMSPPEVWRRGTWPLRVGDYESSDMCPFKKR